MRKNKEIEEYISNIKKSSFKIYSIKASYIGYLNKEILYILIELMGKVINNIPFINNYLKGEACKLEKVEIGEEYIFYKLDFQKEKIVYQSNMPMRVVQHQSVEFMLYYKYNMGLVYENKATDSIRVLSIGIILAYWALISNYNYRNVPFGKPVIDEVDLNLSESYGFFEDYLLKYIKCNSNDFEDKLALMENWWEGDIKRKDYEAKLLRKNSIKYTINRENGEKANVVFVKDGQVKSTIALGLELINKYIFMIYLINNNPSIILPSFNLLNILEEWITYISKDMYEEYKNKKKIAVIQDLSGIASEALKTEGDEHNNYGDILSLSLLAQELFSICKVNNAKPDEEVCFDVIEYDCLCTFLKWYMKEKNAVYLMDEELENIFKVFYLYIRKTKVNKRY